MQSIISSRPVIHSPPGQYPSARVVCVSTKLHNPPTQVGAWHDLNVHPPPVQAGASHSTNMHLPPPQSVGSVQPRNKHFPDKQSLLWSLFLLGHGTTLRSLSSKTGCSTGRTRASVSMAKQSNKISHRNDDIALIGKILKIVCIYSRLKLLEQRFLQTLNRRRSHAIAHHTIHSANHNSHTHKEHQRQQTSNSSEQYTSRASTRTTVSDRVKHITREMPPYAKVRKQKQQKPSTEQRHAFLKFK